MTKMELQVKLVHLEELKKPYIRTIAEHEEKVESTQKTIWQLEVENATVDKLLKKGIARSFNFNKMAIDFDKNIDKIAKLKQDLEALLAKNFDEERQIISEIDYEIERYQQFLKKG